MVANSIHTAYFCLCVHTVKLHSFCFNVNKIPFAPVFFTIGPNYHRQFTVVREDLASACSAVQLQYTELSSLHPQSLYLEPVLFPINYKVPSSHSEVFVLGFEPVTPVADVQLTRIQPQISSPREIMARGRSHHSCSLGVLHWERQPLSQHACLKLLCSTGR